MAVVATGSSSGSVHHLFVDDPALVLDIPEATADGDLLVLGYMFTGDIGGGGSSIDEDEWDSSTVFPTISNMSNGSRVNATFRRWHTGDATAYTIHVEGSNAIIPDGVQINAIMYSFAGVDEDMVGVGQYTSGTDTSIIPLPAPPSFPPPELAGHVLYVGYGELYRPSQTADLTAASPLTGIVNVHNPIAGGYEVAGGSLLAGAWDADSSDAARHFANVLPSVADPPHYARLGVAIMFGPAAAAVGIFIGAPRRIRR